MKQRWDFSVKIHFGLFRCSYSVVQRGKTQNKQIIIKVNAGLGDMRENK